MASKSLIFCFDGTLNHPKDAQSSSSWFRFGKKLLDKNISNILKLHIMFGGKLDNTRLNGLQHSFYYSGIGTYGSLFQKILNATLAPENLDVSTIMKQALKDLKQHYKKGDKIYVFGFSRGAAIARRFCAVLHTYLGYDEPMENLVDFLGVFDTVASIGKPNLDDDTKPMSDVVFENGTISDNIKRALHLLSLDERRIAYQPTLMNAEKRVKEVWFSGTHSDIGGGYDNDGLSDVTLDYMINELDERQLDIMILDYNQIDFDALQTDIYHISPEDLFINVNYLASLHQKERSYAFAALTLSKREVRVNEADQASKNKYPIIYYSVKQRIEHLDDYRPEVLEGKNYYIEHENCYFQTTGFSEYQLN